MSTICVCGYEFGYRVEEGVRLLIFLPDECIIEVSWDAMSKYHGNKTSRALGRYIGDWLYGELPFYG